MKYILTMLFATALFAGCAQQQTANTTASTMNQSTKARLTACITAESTARIQNGTAFNGTLKATANSIASACTKKLAMEKMGLDQETVDLTNTILSGMISANKSK